MARTGESPARPNKDFYYFGSFFLSFIFNTYLA